MQSVSLSCAFVLCRLVTEDTTDNLFYIEPTARLEHVFPYLKEDQIVGNTSILSNLRSQSFEQLFESKSYEKLLALDRSSPSPNPTMRLGSKDHSMWKDVFDARSDHEPDESYVENCDDIDEV